MKAFPRIVHELRPSSTCVRLYQPIDLWSTPRFLKDQVFVDLIVLLITHESITSVRWIVLFPSAHAGSTHCKGIWSSNPSHILALGVDLSGSLASRPGGDPGRNARLDGNSSKVGVHPPGQRRLPAGLKNLGATCYLNSQLQALFANRRFRAGVYAWSPSQRGGKLKLTAFLIEEPVHERGMIPDMDVSSKSKPLNSSP